MGDNDGLLSALINHGTNEVLTINGFNGYFSFAMGNEIALVYNDSYYILNCTQKLWNEVQERFKNQKYATKEIFKWWKEQSKKYEISFWSDSFNDLK